MLRRASRIVGFSIHATDGDIGHVRDLDIDDRRWLVRHLVVEAGHSLPGRQMLVSPRAVAGVRWGGHRVDTRLTRDQVRMSPVRDADRLVSRHADASDEYPQPVVFWIRDDPELRPRNEGDPRLRSLRRITQCTARAVDADVGHVADLLVDVGPWAIGYIVLDLRRWLLAKHVLVPVAVVAWTGWLEKVVHLGVTAEIIRSAPAYDPTHRVSRPDEARLLAHFGDAADQGGGDSGRH